MSQYNENTIPKFVIIDVKYISTFNNIHKYW